MCGVSGIAVACIWLEEFNPMLPSYVACQKKIQYVLIWYMCDNAVWHNYQDVQLHFAVRKTSMISFPIPTHNPLRSRRCGVSRAQTFNSSLAERLTRQWRMKTRLSVTTEFFVLLKSHGTAAISGAEGSKFEVSRWSRMSHLDAYCMQQYALCNEASVHLVSPTEGPPQLQSPLIISDFELVFL